MLVVRKTHVRMGEGFTGEDCNLHQKSRSCLLLVLTAISPEIEGMFGAS